MKISGTTRVAAVVGAPVAHSLSPTIHNAWISAAGLDAVYVALEPRVLAGLVNGLRGGVLRGLNVTAPFKEAALTLADVASARARAACAANLLIFEEDGQVSADNTDGRGLLAAFAEQTPGFDPTAGPVAILGGGGRGAGGRRRLRRGRRAGCAHPCPLRRQGAAAGGRLCAAGLGSWS